MTKIHDCKVYCRFESGPELDIALDMVNLDPTTVPSPTATKPLIWGYGKWGENHWAGTASETFDGDWVDITEDVDVWDMRYGSKSGFTLATGSLTLNSPHVAYKWIDGETNSYNVDGRMYLAFVFYENNVAQKPLVMTGLLEGSNIALYGFYEHLQTEQCNFRERQYWTWSEAVELAMNGRAATNMGEDFTTLRYLQPTLNSTTFECLKAVSQLQGRWACEGPNAQIISRMPWETGKNDTNASNAISVGASGVRINELMPEWRDRYTEFLYNPPERSVDRQYHYIDDKRYAKWGSNVTTLPPWAGNDPEEIIKRYVYLTDPSRVRIWRVIQNATSMNIINNLLGTPIHFTGDVKWNSNEDFYGTIVSMQLRSNSNRVLADMEVVEGWPFKVFRWGISKWGEGDVWG